MADYSQALTGLTESSFTHDGFTHRVFRTGSGPAVIVIHEAPGLHPGVVRVDLPGLGEKRDRLLPSPAPGHAVRLLYQSIKRRINHGSLSHA